MKKKVLSLLFACIMIVSVFAFAGCKADELQAQIDENATKAETAVADTAAKAAKDLADAKAALEALITKGDEADAKALADAVKDLNAAIEAAKTASTGADDALKAELNAAIAAAKTELSAGSETALNAAVKKLEDAVALKVDAATYAKAIADLEAAVAAAKSAADTFAADADAAIKAAEQAATEADAALKAELAAADKKINDDLTAAIAKAQADALADAKAYVDAKVAELSATQTADKSELALAIQEVKDAAAAADKAAKKAAEDATAADGALKADLQAKIDALDAAIKNANLTAENSWEDWNEATDVVIEKLAALRKAEKAFEQAAYYKLLSQATKDKAIELVAETEAKLLRAINKTAAEAEYVYAGDFFATMDAIFKAYDAYNQDYYYASEIAELDAALTKALKAMEASTDETNVPAIKTTLDADLDKVLNKAEAMIAALTADGKPNMAVILNEKWEELLADVAGKLKNDTPEVYEALKFIEVDTLYGEYQTRYNQLIKLKDIADKELNPLAAEWAKHFADANKDKPTLNEAKLKGYAEYLKSVEAWKKDLGETNDTNKALLDNATLATAASNYEARKTALQTYATNLLATLNGYGAEYVYNYSEANQKAVYDLYDEYNAFVVYVEQGLGYPLGAEGNEAYANAFKVFLDGTYTRAKKIEIAKAQAEKIDLRVESLTGYLTYLTSFKSDYQIEMESINEAVKIWKEAFFSGDFAAEMVAGNANYDLLDHAAYAALVELYTAKLGPIEAAIKDVAAKFNAPGFVTINLLSKDDIDAAKKAWETFLVLVADLGLDTDDIEDIGTITGIDGKATTDKIADLLDAKTIEYKAACAAAAVKYDELTILAADKVSIYDEAIVVAMAKWYKTYLGMDISVAASELPADGKDLVLSETVTITDELYAAAKATYTAWKTLSDAKKDEMDQLIADIAAFVNGTINTESRAAYNALKERLDAFLEGDGAIALGYKKSQYNIDPENDTYVVDDSKLAEAGKKIKDLEQKRKALFARIDALATEAGRNDLLDATKETANKALLDTLKADMVAFTAENAGFNCFVESEGTTYTNREIIVDQSYVLIEIAVVYAKAIANVESIATVAVKEDLKARATAARDAAVELILTLPADEWEDSDAFGIEIAKLFVVEETIALYINYVPEKTEEAMAERYENTVKTHINKLTVEKLAAYKLAGEDVEDLIDDVVASIEDAFAKIGTTVAP